MEQEGKRTEEENEGEREETYPDRVDSAGLDDERRRDGAAVTRIYHPSLRSLPPVARWATLHATIHLTLLLADPVPRTFSRAMDRSRRPSVHPYIRP